MNLGLLAGHGAHPQVHVHPRPPGGYRHWLDVPDDHPSQPELKRFEARVRDKTRNLRPVGLLDRILAFFGDLRDGPELQRGGRASVSATAPTPRKPMRWRKARFPEAGTRWDTPMNRFVWDRDHGGDFELWRGDVRLATVKPNGSWQLESRLHPRPHGLATSVDEAKKQAKQAAKEATGLWSAELQGPAKYQGGGGRKLTGHASGSYRGALVDGVEAAEQAIERGGWLPRLASEGARETAVPHPGRSYTSRSGSIVLCDYCDEPAVAVRSLGDVSTRRFRCREHRESNRQGEPLEGRSRLPEMSFESVIEHVKQTLRARRIRLFDGRPHGSPRWPAPAKG